MEESLIYSMMRNKLLETNCNVLREINFFEHFARAIVNQNGQKWTIWKVKFNFKKIKIIGTFVFYDSTTTLELLYARNELKAKYTGKTKFPKVAKWLFLDI